MILQNFFQCLAVDEFQWGYTKQIPLFGCAHYVWSREDWKSDPQYAELAQHAAEVKGFYDFWSNFKTNKSFEWVIRYTAHPDCDARTLR